MQFEVETCIERGEAKRKERQLRSIVPEAFPRSLVVKERKTWKEDEPQALQVVFPSASLLHSGVVLVPQLIHTIPAP
jgi:hypothetical protein